MKNTNKPILVIKFGTASITHGNGELNESVIAEIAKQVAAVHDRYNVVLVSSGAVAAGKRFLKDYTGTISERKAAAAIGNPLLLNRYTHYFSQYGIPVAQSLCERSHFSNRNQFLQLHKTYEELWASGIIPIANENDVVSDLELKFSDNDELATLIAVGFGASMLLFSTSVGGVLDREGKIVPLIPVIDEQAFSSQIPANPALGLEEWSQADFRPAGDPYGHPGRDLRHRYAGRGIAGRRRQDRHPLPPQPCSMPARRKWLASGSLVTGRIQVDAGAQQALERRHSLLAVGVRQVLEKFECGEVIEIAGESGEVFAVARAKVSSESLGQRAKNVEVAHADEIVIL